VRRTVLMVVTLLAVSSAPSLVRADETAAVTASELPERRPWTIYGSVGFPGITSFALARWAGPVEIMAELGTLAPFPVLFTGTVHLQFDLVRGRRLALFTGASATSLYFWFTGYDGDGSPFWNWGAGPKLGLRYILLGKALLVIEGGALYGDWEGTCKSCKVMPEVMARLGWTF